MKINLVYNSNAGNGDFSLAAILEELNQHGAKVNVKESHEDNLGLFLDKDCDFMIIAGGDGTVEKIVKMVVNKSVPLAILPVGNANNIANSLDLGDYLDQVIQNWKENRLECLSLGSLAYKNQRHLFLESVGWGLFTDVLRKIKSGKDKDKKVTPPVDDKVTFGLEKLEEGLVELQPAFFEIKMDGKDYSGEYLWLEAMNTQFMGPQLNLAPEADLNDVFLDVFMAKRGEHTKIREFITGDQSKKTSGLRPTVKVKEIMIRGEGILHVDDEIVDLGADKTAWISITLHPEFVRIIKSSWFGGMMTQMRF
ncbi:diacylglycerol/lipid kinase family protein [Negadavirga shengliensis]|uniref:Diacylglycerol/lipid kinase family protein n=1 Tax=Negadavirga shengliensis TaxID=1389218 RepID=A0ABV9T646_9BACT